MRVEQIEDRIRPPKLRKGVYAVLAGVISLGFASEPGGLPGYAGFLIGLSVTYMVLYGLEHFPSSHPDHPVVELSGAGVSRRDST